MCMHVCPGSRLPVQSHTALEACLLRATLCARGEAVAALLASSRKAARLHTASDHRPFTTQEQLYPTQPNGAPTPPALLGADALCGVLTALRERWGVPLLACTFKRPLDGSEAQVAAAPTSVAANTVNAGGNRRFSAVAHGLVGCAAGCECTAGSSVEHHPVQARG